jgi:hypothetical protein
VIAAAAKDESLLMLSILIQNGATREMLGRYGLPHAFFAGNDDAVRLLLQAGAPPSGPFKYDGILVTPFEMAAGIGKVELLKLMIHQGDWKEDIPLMVKAACQAAKHVGLAFLKVLIWGSGSATYRTKAWNSWNHVRNPNSIIVSKFGPFS